MMLHQLLTIMPHLGTLRAAGYVGHLTNAMDTWDIDSAAAQAMFLANLAHESSELRKWEEEPFTSPTGRKYPEAYEGRKELGNNQVGDGVRYKGRGPLQLTGRANYRLAGEGVSEDLENHPELLLRADIGFQVSGWFWSTHCARAFPDFLAVVKAWNGGTNGLKQREHYWQLAKKALGVPDVQVVYPGKVLLHQV